MSLPFLVSYRNPVVETILSISLPGITMKLTFSLIWKCESFEAFTVILLSRVHSLLLANRPYFFSSSLGGGACRLKRGLSGIISLTSKSLNPRGFRLISMGLLLAEVQLIVQIDPIKCVSIIRRKGQIGRSCQLLKRQTLIILLEYIDKPWQPFVGQLLRKCLKTSNL